MNVFYKFLIKLCGYIFSIFFFNNDSEWFLPNSYLYSRWCRPKNQLVLLKQYLISNSKLHCVHWKIKFVSMSKLNELIFISRFVFFFSWVYYRYFLPKSKTLNWAKPYLIFYNKKQNKFSTGINHDFTSHKFIISSFLFFWLQVQ